jgi:hypothetical protein
MVQSLITTQRFSHGNNSIPEIQEKSPPP